ncbi:serine hydrolase [Demequina sp. NBRC 110053]|uniref:serine hydrolase domain-containing protein n=1 Tax=Demequina sp. NBRC 110053 TaxID=1570342 RepID=UPI000A0197A5|nr:serine hydrolase domain-containing protein [Demequina sp. NBRC 110053]
MSIDLAALHRLLHARHDRVLLAATRGGEAAWRAFGVPDSADAEIGSVSKGLTGLLYRDAVERGEVTEETALGELLGRPEASYAPLALGAVSQHRSGLPRLQPHGGERSQWSRTWRMWRRGENPYGDTVAELLDLASDVPVGKPRFSYSNLGFELLGAALARRAGQPYGALLRERVLEPLGMTGTYVPARETDLRAGALRGRAKGGRPHEPWTGEAIGPAGGVRSTGADLAALLRGLVSGSAPGASALQPDADAQGSSRIGAAWITIDDRGSSVTWHNGMTGGFASFVGVDRGAGVGVAIVSATAARVDSAGFRALAALRERA